MPLTEENSHGTQPLPTTGHPLPRRSSPENSITLKHHRLAHHASHRTATGPGPSKEPSLLSRRNSSGESHNTGQSDPNNWFDRSNQNPTATFDNSVMEVDPPFFQKEPDSSEDKPLTYDRPNLPTRRSTHSSSADDYRSVIDDLTVEIQRLKEELKRYKQAGPDMLRKEKLFEIKVHGLPQKKKRELEATLRDFAASLKSSPGASSSQKKTKSSRRTTPRDTGYLGSESLSKHASSSSGSHFRPADSAYASMSIGAKSSGHSLKRPMMNTKASNEMKVENYLRDIPEGLYPRHMIMTDKERKKIVVRRLERLFTGKLGGRRSQQKQADSQDGKSTQAPANTDLSLQPPVMNAQSSGDFHELTREAKILPLEQQSGHSGKKSRSRDNGSTSNSHGDTTESGGNGNSTGSNPSPPMRPPLDQRPTRPRDLDPDRVQIPSENIDYIRHLGLVPPELLPDQQNLDEDVRPDEEGWVYLNLLCNLAQLHIINVTPDFVRSAVAGMSTKFQLSPDGRKIRWRGGTEGTKFSSDSSGYNSQKTLSTDDSEGSKKPHKRHKKSRLSGDNTHSGGSSKHTSKFGQNPSSESFHYKPIFAQRDSSGGITSIDETTLSSFGPPEESNVDDSRWDMSGSGTSNRRKRRHDGAIIYYSGAPFCTDLSGDPGDISPSQVLLASQTTQDSQLVLPRLPPKRTSSGSFINYRPLSDKGQFLLADPEMDVDVDVDVANLTSDGVDGSNDIDLNLAWSSKEQYIELQTLEPCGLGGVLPDDHFVVVVTTKRPKQDVDLSNRPHRHPNLDESTDGIIRRLATMSTSSPDLHASNPLPKVRSPRPFEVEYVSGNIKWLSPTPLPPPALFFPPFSTDESSNGDVFTSDINTESSEESSSRRANPHESDDYPDGVDLSSGDEDGDDPDESPDDTNMYDIDTDNNTRSLLNRRRISPTRRSSSAAAAAGTAGGGSKSTSAERMLPGDGSSAATAGGAESGYSSEEEESG